MRGLAVLAGVLVLAGCSATSTLYPDNDQAKSMGILHATFMRRGTGAGEATMTLPSGEVLNGEYRVVDGGSYGIGTAFSSTRAPGATAPVTTATTATTTQVAGANDYVAIMYGDRGTSVDCSGFTNSWGGHGSGVCKFSTGEVFRTMH